MSPAEELTACLKLVVARPPARFGWCHSFIDEVADLGLDVVDFFGCGKDLFFTLLGNRDRVIGIAAEDVAGLDVDIADIDGAVHRLHLHVHKDHLPVPSDRIVKEEIRVRTPDAA